MAGAGPVDAHQQPGPKAGRDLADRRGQHGDVIGDGAGAGVPGRSSIARLSVVFASQAPSGWKP
jgi:hypothetical protein